MTSLKHGEFTKGPWTIRQYGIYAFDPVNRTVGVRYTINEIGVDVHTRYDGSKSEEEYPDSVIMRGEDVREVVALLRAAPLMRDVLQEIAGAAAWTRHGLHTVPSPLINQLRKVLAYAISPVGIEEGA